MNNLTQTKAKNKWCHLKLNGPHRERSCLASDCMAWRWEDAGFEIERVYSEQIDNQGEYFPCWPNGANWEMCDQAQSKPSFGMKLIAYKRPWGDKRKGFCGLCEPRIADVEVSS